MHVITTSPDLAAAVGRLSSAEFVAIDTEFMREQTFWPKLCLIQLAGPDDEVVVDPLATGLDLAPFHALMANEAVLKVFHAARQDIEILYAAAGRMPRPVFDTQVAAMVCGFGESVSYVNLVQKVTGVTIDKSSRFTDWSRRPLSDAQLTYAIGDVTHLRRVYEYLAAELEATGRTTWVKEEMEELVDPKTYATDPADSWKRLKLKVKNKKALAALIELAVWREKLAQAQDVPRGRILRDDALYDIANHVPTSAEQLSGLRTLNEGFSRSARAREIVEAVKRGLERDPKSLPRMDEGQPLSAREGAVVELLRVLLRALAARHKVAPRLIADTDDLERIVVERQPDVAALKGWRRHVFGEEALRLTRGETALMLRNGEVVTAPAPEPEPRRAAVQEEASPL